MPLQDIYRELRILEPTLNEVPDLVSPGELAAALSVVGGNERLEAVSSLLVRIRRRITALEDVPRSLKLRIAVLANSIKRLDLLAGSIFNEIVTDFESRQVRYELIAPSGDDLPYVQFQKHYPLASWRFVDWSLVAGGKCFNVNDPILVRQHFRDCCHELAVTSGSVFITEGIFEASMRMTVEDLLEHSDVLFSYCSDMLLIGENATWVFEVFHEGEIGYGAQPSTAHR